MRIILKSPATNHYLHSLMGVLAKPSDGSSTLIPLVESLSSVSSRFHSVPAMDEIQSHLTRRYQLLSHVTEF